jgi:hypothetical protein
VSLPPLVIPDAMPDIRNWFRTNEWITPHIAGRAFFRLPVNPNPNKVPFIRVSRSGGGVQSNSEAPVSDIRVAVEVWGMAGKDYDKVRAAVLAIEQAALVLQPGTILGDGGTRGLNVNVTTSFDSPDPDTGWPRMMMDIIFTVAL